MATAASHRRGPIPLKAWPGVARESSRAIDVLSTAAVDAGATHTWAYLDNAAELQQLGRQPVGTLLCVHGNPTWSYLWRNVVTAGAADPEFPWRVVAVDQLNMGFSARTGTVRTLEERITDLGDFTRALGLDEDPGEQGIVTLAHDWGGLISQGWGLEHPQLHTGRILTNTALHYPADEPIPAALRLALNPAVHGPGTETTTAFLDTTLSLAQRAWDPEVKKAYRSPYCTAEQRTGIRDFVADIPARLDHRSRPALERIAAESAGDQLPTLILWGPHDPVFQQRCFDDLLKRFPQAQVHRYEKAGHLLAEDEAIEEPILTWLGESFGYRAAAQRSHQFQRSTREQNSRLAEHYRPMLAELEARREDPGVAVVDMGKADAGQIEAPIKAQLSWAELNQQVDHQEQVLRDLGVVKGTRVSLMVPPGAQLTVLIYACLRIGAVIVVADTGLGLRGLTHALRGASPEVLIGIPRALAAARTLRWPGRRVLAGTATPLKLRALGAEAATESHRPGVIKPLAAWQRPTSEDLAAILFTSGSTGPAKGVCYTHRQLAAMRAAIQRTYNIRAGSGLVAGFAPFALLGPALGATSVTPDMDVTSPKTLTATALAQAAQAIEATVVFASPAALMNVVATQDALTLAQRNALARVQRLLSAGAPLALPLLRQVARMVPQASVHTPYGMTEALPVSDVSLTQILDAEQDAADGMTGAGNGVCVGTPVYGASIALAALDEHGQPGDQPTHHSDVTGEILVAAPHLKERYDRLWWTDHAAISIPGWHRTGDLGHFDDAGRLWVEGRLAHLIHTAEGVITPVSAEAAAESLPQVRRAAVVGVGPVGTQVPVAVLELRHPVSRPGPAGQDLVEAVRRAVSARISTPLAAVLVVPEQPTDIRHNSKIDRPRLAAWAQRVLSGGKVGQP